MLEISGIKAGYGSMAVLHGVDMQIGAGEIIALLGSNGVGKTTLNNVISGFIRPTAGAIRFEGDTITGRRTGARGAQNIPQPLRARKSGTWGVLPGIRQHPAQFRADVHDLPAVA